MILYSGVAPYSAQEIWRWQGSKLGSPLYKAWLVYAQPIELSLLQSNIITRVFHSNIEAFDL